MTTTPSQMLSFPPFTLDPVEMCLWRGKQRMALSPKDFAVLHYLVFHANQLVPQDVLLRVGWPAEVVAPGVLKVRLRRLRQMLGDTADAPRFIETVRGYGYRFIAAVMTAAPVQSSTFQVQRPGQQEARDWRLETSSTSPQQASSLKPLVSPLVGREAELTHLHKLLEKAVDGERQLVFVTGEPGLARRRFSKPFGRD